MAQVIVVNDPEARTLLSSHRALDAVHDDLDPTSCVCANSIIVLQRPRQTGNICSNCGGMAIQTGTCTTCTECGTAGGCN